MSLVPASELRPLYGVSNTASLAAIIGNVACLALAIAAATHFDHLLVSIVAIIVIAARQHALLVLAHEVAHRTLLTHRTLNDLAGELLTGALFGDLASYRADHLAHHAHLNTADDPDWARTHDPDDDYHRQWQLPMPAPRLFGIFARDLLGLSMHQLLRIVVRYSRVRRARAQTETEQAPSATKRAKATVIPGWVRLALYLGLFAALTLSGSWLAFLLYWFIPAMTGLRFIMRLRHMAEQFAIPSMGGGVCTRTVTAPPWQRFLLAPHNVNFHAEHHLYPGVSFRRLPELHELVRTHGGFEADMHVSGDYVDVVRELSATS